MYIIPSFHPLVMIIIIIDDKNNDSDNAVSIIGEFTANAKDSDISKKFMDFGSFIWKTEICPIIISPNGNVFIGEKWKNISNKKVSVVNLLKSSQ